MDPRWQNLPHTHAKFAPKTYPDRETWERERARLRTQILFAAGLWPMPEKPPLEIRIFDRVERDGYTLEKAHFQSLPNFYVGGSLFRPVDPKPNSHPGILSPHGHAKLGRLQHGDTSYPARGITFARMGCTAFMWDMVDYNDSARHLSGAYQEETYGVVHRAPWAHEQDERMLWNIGILGLQLWNGIRALDFLCELPEVDAARLGCTGESGGGTQTYNLYAVDDRLQVAAPVCMVSAFMQGGCVCENAPSLRVDTHNVDIGATFAPKPLLLVSSAQDWTQHTPTVEYPAIKRIYDLYGAGDCVSQIQIDAPHGYDLDMREAVYRWFAKWLDLPVGDDFVEPAFEVEEHKDMLAFFDGLPDGAITRHEDLIQQCIAASKTALEAYRPSRALAENRRVLGQALRVAVGYGDSAVVYERDAGTRFAAMPCEDGTLIGSRRGSRVPIRTFVPAAPSDTSALLLHPRGMDALYSPIIRALLDQGQTVYAVDLFGVGRNVGEENPEEPRGSSPFFNTFNRTDDAERVGDILLALRHVPSGPLTIAGFGRAGLWALIAGAISERADLQLACDVGAFDTGRADDYLHRLPIPGILKAGGLPNAAALVAPNKLLLHNAGDAFDTSWAEAAYARHPEATLTIQRDRVKNGALIDFSSRLNGNMSA